MNKKDLKDLIKPLVKECINESVQEILLESGLLSQVISEVLKGIGTNTIVEQVVPQETRMAQVAKKSEKKAISETRKKMMDAIGKTSYGGVNIFEGIHETIPDETTTGPANPMQGIAPNDSGVDISQLFDFNKAKILAQGKKKEGK